MHHTDDVESADDFVDSDLEYDGRTPLDKTIDRIGMGASFVSPPCFPLPPCTPGSYQWTLLSLCGFGEHLFPLISFSAD